MVLRDDDAETVLQLGVGELDLGQRRSCQAERDDDAGGGEAPNRRGHDTSIELSADRQLSPGERTQKEAEGQTFCLESRLRRCQCARRLRTAGARHSVRPSRGCGRPEADREAPCESADVVIMDTGAGPPGTDPAFRPRSDAAFDACSRPGRNPPPRNPGREAGFRVVDRCSLVLYASTLITTRRFCARPSFVLLGAIGFSSP